MRAPQSDLPDIAADTLERYVTLSQELAGGAAP